MTTEAAATESAPSTPAAGFDWDKFDASLTDGTYKDDGDLPAAKQEPEAPKVEQEAAAEAAKEEVAKPEEESPETLEKAADLYAETIKANREASARLKKVAAREAQAAEVEGRIADVRAAIEGKDYLRALMRLVPEGVDEREVVLGLLQEREPEKPLSRADVERLFEEKRVAAEKQAAKEREEASERTYAKQLDGYLGAIANAATAEGFAYVDAEFLQLNRAKVEALAKEMFTKNKVIPDVKEIAEILEDREIAKAAKSNRNRQAAPTEQTQTIPAVSSSAFNDQGSGVIPIRERTDVDPFADLDRRLNEKWGRR